MKIGVAGYGSIGRRHVSNLISIGYTDILLFRERGSGNEHGLKETRDLREFVSEDFDFVLVSNPTSSHLETVKPFLLKGTNLLVEKPAVAGSQEVSELEGLLKNYRGKSMVAYNMRFHPAVRRVKDLLTEGIIGKPYSARLTVGQYLPDWRPGTDYSKGVSALRSLGGGVVLELIHEIDLAVFLFGRPLSEVRSFAGKFSSLNIETEDLSEIIYCSDRGTAVSIHQDYLYRGYRRSVEIIGEKGTVICDLKNNTVSVTGQSGEEIITENFRFERNEMYLSLIEYYISCLKRGEAPVPDLEESLESVKIALEVKSGNNL